MFLTGQLPTLPSRALGLEATHSFIALLDMQMYSKALVVLPYISVVAEKTEHLTKVLKAMKCKVKGYFGSGEGGVPLAPG